MIRSNASKLRNFILFIILLTLISSFGIGFAYANIVQEPIFQAISVSASTGSPGDTITVTVSTAGGAATGGGQVAYLSPNGAMWYVDLNYDSTSGKLTGSFAIDYYDVPGLWEVAYVDIAGTLVDGDVINLSAGNVTVTNPHPDVTVPTFSSIQLSRTQTNPGGKVHVTINASDSESGLEGAFVVWERNLDTIEANLSLNEKTGMLEGDLYIPLEQPVGTYTLSAIVVFDEQSNEYVWSVDKGPAITDKNLVLSSDANAPVAGYIDVHPGDWFAEYVLFLTEFDVIGGYSDGTFRPASNVTRAEFAKIICRASGWELEHPAVASFSDVPSNSWAYDYIETAKAHGVINGYPGGLFKPNDKISRAEICKMLISACGLDIDASGTSFLDVPSDHWAWQYIMTARNNEFVSGYAGNVFKPSAFATRAEAAKMISNSFNYLGL